MAPLIKLFTIVISASVAVAFTPSVSRVQKLSSSTQLYEDFGLGLGEQTYENQPDLLKGEQEYKQYANRINEDNMLNRKYNVLGRVRELDLIQTTIDNGILSKLEDNGLDLVTLEKLLPLADKFGVLNIAGNNQQLLVNLVAPLLVEGAPFILPVAAAALEIGPIAFFGTAAALAGTDFLLFSNHVTIPFVGLSAGFFLGLILVPLAVVLAVLGGALTVLNQNNA